jgi:hypothetical protein
MLKFLQDYQTQYHRTQVFCAKVRALELLEPMQADVQMRSGERLSLRGFMAVNRTKLKALQGDKLAELAKTDELELLYLHLQSMRNFTSLPERIATVQSGQVDKEQIETTTAPGSTAVNGGEATAPASIADDDGTKAIVEDDGRRHQATANQGE